MFEFYKSGHWFELGYMTFHESELSFKGLSNAGITRRERKRESAA